MQKKLSDGLFFIALILLLTSVFSLIPPYQTSGAVAGKWTTDLSAAVALAKTNGNYVVIFYGSGTCSFCETALRNVFNTQTFYSWAAEKGVPLVYVNSDNMLSLKSTVRSRYGFSGTVYLPTIIFVKGETDTKIKSVLFRSSRGYSSVADFLAVAPQVESVPVCTAEVCDGVDNDCDGQIDEGLSNNAYYIDTDDDGFGSGTAIYACLLPAGNYSTASTDCNNLNANIYPGATEVCNGVDDDCDGKIDDGFECAKNSTNCTSNCFFATRRTSTCAGSVPSEGIANKADNKYSEKWNGSIWAAIENKTYKYSQNSEDCTFSCNEGYYGEGTACLPYLCSPADYDLSKAVLCKDDNTGLLNEEINSLVPQCSAEKKCEYICKSGFSFGIVNGIRTCTENAYKCTGTPDTNSEMYDGDDNGLTADTQISLSAVNSSAKCQYHCIKNFLLNSEGTECIPNPFVCKGNIGGENTEIYLDDNLDLTHDTNFSFADSNTSEKCEYHCKKGYRRGSGLDENNCIQNEYFCTGVIDTNAVMCTDDNLGLDENTPVSIALTCTAAKKCEWICNADYSRGTGPDQSKCIPKSGYLCEGDAILNAEMYEGDDENIAIMDNRTNILTFENTSLKCEWHCRSGYFLADSNNGYVCQKENSSTEFFCMGAVDSNAVMISGDASDLDANYPRVLVSTNTSRKCEYVCRSGFYLGSVSGVDVCLKSMYSCKGSIPNAVIYIGDDSGLSKDTNSILSSQNTSKKCEYHCVKNYSLKDNACVPITLATAVCGNAMKSFTPLESFPGSYTLCDVGTPSVANPVLGDQIASITEWTCISDINALCAATRVSSKYVEPVDNNTPTKNSIVEISSSVSGDGNVKVTVKCEKTTVVSIGVKDYLSKKVYSSEEKKYDCSPSGNTYELKMSDTPQTERSVVITASMGGTEECTACDLNYFMEYTPTKSSEDNSIWVIVLILMSLGIIGTGAFILFKDKLLKK